MQVDDAEERLALAPASRRTGGSRRCSCRASCRRTRWMPEKMRMRVISLRSVVAGRSRPTRASHGAKAVLRAEDDPPRIRSVTPARADRRAERVDTVCRTTLDGRGRHLLSLVAVLLARLRGAAAARMARRGAAGAAVERLKRYPPLVFAGEARRAAGRPRRLSTRAARSCSRRATAPSRSTSSRSVRIREKLKIMLQMSAVLTYGATLPDRQGRPDRGAVRQAALGADRAGRRARAAGLPRPHDPRRRADARGAHARPDADGRGLQPVRRDAQPAARLHEGRLRRPDAGAPLEQGLRRAARPRAGATRRSPARSSARSSSWPPAAST